MGDPDSVGEPGDRQSVDDPDLAWRQERFRRIYEEHHRYIWRYCLRRCFDRAEAEESFNSTFMAAWQRLDDIPPNHPYRRWLTMIAHNHLRNGWRKAGRYHRLKQRVGGLRSERTGPDPADLAPSANSEVVQALARLRPADQEILRLVAWEELTHSEIAEVLACSESNVKVRLHRARKRLDAEMTKLRSDGVAERSGESKSTRRETSTAQRTNGSATASSRNEGA